MTGDQSQRSVWLSPYLLLTLTALFWAGNFVVFLRESLQAFHFAGAGLIGAGIYLATTRKAGRA